jgi:hypothetical protein
MRELSRAVVLICYNGNNMKFYRYSNLVLNFRNSWNESVIIDEIKG